MIKKLQYLYRTSSNTPSQETSANRDAINQIIDVVNDLVAGKIEIKPIDMCPECGDMIMEYRTNATGRKFYTCPKCMVIYNG